VLNGKLKGIIFDFDGTLATLTLDFDKIKRKIASLGAIFLEEDREVLLKNAPPVLEFIEILTARVAEMDRDLALEFNTRCRLLLVDMEMRAAKRGRLFPYSREIIYRLRERAIGVGVITRNCTPAVRQVYPEIEKEVDVFLPREEVEEVKPHPSHLLSAVEKLGIGPEHTLYVGDHPIDITCAKKAGTWSGAVLTGISSRREIERCDPDIVVEDIRELYKKVFI